MKLRLVHVLAEQGWSGGEVQLDHVVRHLNAQGHDNALVLPRGARFAAVGRELGLPITTANLRRPLTTAATWALRRFVTHFDPDVLHFGCGRSLLWGGLATVGLRRPVKVTTRRIDYPIGRAPHRALRYRRLVDHVVANCASVRQRVLDAGVPPARVTLVHEGIDVAPWIGAEDDRDAARRRLDLPPSAVVVSCAATLRPRKGQRELIDAFRDLAARHPEVVLFLAGGGPDREGLLAHAAAVGLASRIRIPGPVDPVRDVYAASDVFVMPSRHEGLSNACLEASAAGLPLVVSDVGGLPEIVVDGETGFVVPPGDRAALVDRMGRLLADQRVRLRFGAAGRLRTEAMFTAERSARGMEQLFERLVAGRRDAEHD